MSMTAIWVTQDTTTHQDHVIAHVLGATPLGYFIFDEVLHILLDIGFVWTILLDSGMGLLPHPVAVNDLVEAGELKEQLRADIDKLMRDDASSLALMQLLPANFPITNVSLWCAGDEGRLLVAGDDASLEIQISIANREFHIMVREDEETNEEKPSELDDDKLANVANREQEYLHERLRNELGREPTEVELDEWLRQHTEGY